MPDALSTGLILQVLFHPGKSSLTGCYLQRHGGNHGHGGGKRNYYSCGQGPLRHRRSRAGLAGCWCYINPEDTGSPGSLAGCRMLECVDLRRLI